MPSASIASTASKSARASVRDTAAPRAPSRTSRRRPNRCPHKRQQAAARGRRAAPRDAERIHRAVTDRMNERAAFDQLVARHREEPPFRRCADPVAGSPDALQRDRDRSRRTELHDEIDRADVDAELERGRRHHRPQLAVFEPVLGCQAEIARKAAVMRQRRGLLRAARRARTRRVRSGGACRRTRASC